MTITEFKSTPIGSLLLLAPEERQSWIEIFFKLPTTLKSVASSPRSGAYIRGLTKNYQLTEDAPPQVAFIILQILFGELSLSELGVYLSSELKIANDKAQRVAAEIEHDLFAPVAGELSQYLASKKQGQASSATTSAREAGATNVLNLSQPAQRPPARPTTPKPLPPRPPQIPQRGRDS